MSNEMAFHLNNFCDWISYISVPSTTVSPSFSIMLWTSWIWSSLPSSLWRWYSNWSPSNPGWVIQTHRYTPLYIITQFPFGHSEQCSMNKLPSIRHTLISSIGYTRFVMLTSLCPTTAHFYTCRFVLRRRTEC